MDEQGRLRSEQARRRAWWQLERDGVRDGDSGFPFRFSYPSHPLLPFPSVHFLLTIADFIPADSSFFCTPSLVVFITSNLSFLYSILQDQSLPTLCLTQDSELEPASPRQNRARILLRIAVLGCRCDTILHKSSTRNVLHSGHPAGT